MFPMGPCSSRGVGVGVTLMGKGCRWQLERLVNEPAGVCEVGSPRRLPIVCLDSGEGGQRVGGRQGQHPPVMGPGKPIAPPTSCPGSCG